MRYHHKYSKESTAVLLVMRCPRCCCLLIAFPKGRHWRHHPAKRCCQETQIAQTGRWLVTASSYLVQPHWRLGAASNQITSCLLPLSLSLSLSFYTTPHHSFFLSHFISRHFLSCVFSQQYTKHDLPHSMIHGRQAASTRFSVLPRYLASSGQA